VRARNGAGPPQRGDAAGTRKVDALGKTRPPSSRTSHPDQYGLPECLGDRIHSRHGGLAGRSNAQAVPTFETDRRPGGARVGETIPARVARRHGIAVPRNESYIRAQHAEIKRRYAWKFKQRRIFPRDSDAALCSFRLRSLEALFARRYGATLPCDDAGVGDFIIAANHIALLGSDAIGHIIAWAAIWLPDMPRTEVLAHAKRIAANPRKYTAATLGKMLRLTREERSDLNITTIRAFDMLTDAEVAEERKRKSRERAARWRQRQQKAPRPIPLRESEPWVALGMSQRTWYRRGKPTAIAVAKNRVRSRESHSCCVRNCLPSRSLRARDAVHTEICRHNGARDTKGTSAKTNASRSHTYASRSNGTRGDSARAGDRGDVANGAGV
jgi:hypothetical protein